jgi:16S rRNA processing protein RimM
MARSPRSGETSDPAAGWLIVAELGPAHGIRGEITARVSGIEPSALAGVEGLVLRTADGAERPVRVSRVRAKKTGPILAIDSVATRTEAESLRNGVLLARREALPEPDEGEWWVADLLGLAVESDEGEELGTLEEVIPLPANDVLVVRGRRGEVLLPLTEEVVREVDLAAKRMVVRILPGLLDEPGSPGGRGGPRGGDG